MKAAMGRLCSWSPQAQSGCGTSPLSQLADGELSSPVHVFRSLLSRELVQRLNMHCAGWHVSRGILGGLVMPLHDAICLQDVTGLTSCDTWQITHEYRGSWHYAHLRQELEPGHSCHICIPLIPTSSIFQVLAARACPSTARPSQCCA